MHEEMTPAGTEPAGLQTPFPWRELAAPLLALALSALYWAAFSVSGLMLGYGPGLGVLALVLCYFGAVALLLGRRFRPRASGFCLMAAAIALALCCALYFYAPLFPYLNCFVILLCAASATFIFSGQLGERGSVWRAIPAVISLSARALFTRVNRPFQALHRAARGRAAAVGRVVLTVAASAALLAVVLALLATADMVFGSFFAGIGRWLSELDPAIAIWRVTRWFGLGLFVCSGLYFIREDLPAAPAAPRPTRERHTLPFLLPALLLDAVYAAFCAIQLRYLFGGAQAASMAGGWAEYARTGFFQLVAVAVISLTLCLLGADGRRFARPGGRALRIADAVLLALTAVILVSAARRMQLYILAFGLSILRLLTLWGMVVVAAGLLLGAWKLARPDFPFGRFFCGFALATWCLLCLANPAGRVAQYNVDAYLSGQLEEVDMDYLESLSPDASRALTRLREHDETYRREAQGIQNRMAHLREEGDARWANRRLFARRGTDQTMIYQGAARPDWSGGACAYPHSFLSHLPLEIMGVDPAFWKI